MALQTLIDKEIQMKAAIYRAYGSVDVIEIKDVDQPIIARNELLIKVHSSSLTPSDIFFRKGEPFVTRLMSGIRRPKRIPGFEFSGEVVQAGDQVSEFKVNDSVFGLLAKTSGTHAEYVVIKESDVVVAKPASLTADEAVWVCDGGLTALVFLRDQAKLKSGESILINGASGAVGSYAVQLAKYFGTKVTGVCSTANLEFVRALGADQVIDYKHSNFTDAPDSHGTRLRLSRS